MRFLPALFLSSLFFTSTAQAETWELDPSHSKVGFGVTHLMVSTVEGHFDDVKATLEYDVGEPGDLSVSVTVDMASVNTANAKRDEHLRTSEFFAVSEHPQMTFVSKKVKAGKKGELTVTGDLTLRGVTKSVTLEGKGLETSVKDPWGNERVGVRATAVIDRQDFGVSWNQALEAGGMVVGNEVTLEIQAEFIRQ